MAHGNTLTGRNGKFFVADANVLRATQWAVSPKLAATSEWGDSDSAGYTNRAPGRWDCTFTAEGKYDSGEAIWTVFMPGDYALVRLFMNGETLWWDFPSALCTEFNLSVNIDTEEVIGWTSSWGSDGTFAHPT